MRSHRHHAGHRVCFVSCLAWPGISESDAHVERALARQGVTVTARPWNDPAARFDDFDAVVFRSNWDYHHAPAAFLQWLERWETAGVRFWNPPGLIRWNLTKRYLLDLEAAGVDIIPTVIVDAAAARHLPGLLAERGWDTAVLKPVVAASAHGTTLVTAAGARTLDETVLRYPVLVQPFMEEIRTRGEWSLVFIDGELTHAVVKRPAPGDFRVQPHHGGTWTAAAPGRALAAAGGRVLEALPLPPLYARVDGIEIGAAFLVMEVELHEPGLFFPAAPAAAEAFAAAIMRRF